METKIINLLLEKFVNEEIMTKSEFEKRIDAIMDKHEANMNAKFQAIDGKFKGIRDEIHNRYNWIIGITITSTIGIIGVFLKLTSMLPH